MSLYIYETDLSQLYG